MKKSISTSTVGRSKPIKTIEKIDKKEFILDKTHIYLGDSLNLYEKWKKPVTIISDGAYGVLGFEGDTSDHIDLPQWYEPHIKMWSSYATPQTTLWFWNSEIGWATVHPLLEKYGWRYINSNTWNKGLEHIAGNVNTSKIRRFPVVTEVCVQYIFEAKINNMTLKKWLLSEWKRAKLSIKLANEACGVKNAASRKYFDQGHLWYFPPIEMMIKLVEYANKNGDPKGIPYYSLNGLDPITANDWSSMRSKFSCPYGITNVWNRSPVRDSERVTTKNGKAIHLNQKPLDLMCRIIEATTESEDVVWEPFGGLFTASLASKKLNRISFAAEIDEVYYQYGIERFKNQQNILL
jgi:hypothetical protein